MNHRHSFAFILIGAQALTVFAAPNADAASLPPPPPTCLSPMQPNEVDPSPRNIIYSIDPTKPLVTVSACIVSNMDRIATMGVSFGLFDTGGNFIGVNGQGLGELGPIVDPTPNHPRIINLSAVTIMIDPKYADQLLATTLIELQWAPCKNPSPAQCEPDTIRTTTFLRDMTAVSVGKN